MATNPTYSGMALEQTIYQVRNYVLRYYGELYGNEERCRQRVVDPLLSALGWNLYSEEVVVEYALSKPSRGSKGRPPTLDYVLYGNLPWARLPRVVLEAKHIKKLKKDLLTNPSLWEKNVLKQLEELGYSSLLSVFGNLKCDSPEEECANNQSSNSKPPESDSRSLTDDTESSGKVNACPEYCRLNSGIPAYEIGTYILPARIVITSGIDWLFINLKPCISNSRLYVDEVVHLDLFKENIYKAAEMLRSKISPEAVNGLQDVIWPQCAPVNLRTVVLDPRFHKVTRGLGGNLCLYYLEKVGNPPVRITQNPVGLTAVISEFETWLSNKYPSSPIPYVPKTGVGTVGPVLANLYDMVVKYWERFPFNGVNPDTIAVYSNAWPSEIVNCGVTAHGEDETTTWGEGRSGVSEG